MPRTCQSEGCTNNVFGGNMCKFHQYKRTDKKPTSFKSVGNTFNSNAKPIAKNSKKRNKINRNQYEQRARQFRSEKEFCEVCPILIENGIETKCGIDAQCVHHIYGKATIELLLDQNGWMASCFWANGIWIEENSAKAFELGLKIPNYNSKLSKFKNK